MNATLLHNARLPDGRTRMSILIQGTRIAAIEPDAILADAVVGHREDAQGYLVSPSFVDAHFHMDSTLRYGQPRVNESGTLFEGIQIWGELKPTLTRNQIVQTATRYCQWAVANGLLAIRSHVDISDPKLLAVQALLEVQQSVREHLTLQLVAFPQDGLLRHPGSLEQLERALDMGVNVVGGIPHYERTSQEGARSIEILCELAARRDLMVDMHCDETDDPWSRHIETLTFQTQRLGLQGRVTGSHLCSMHSMDNDYASKLIGLMAESSMHVISNPLINMTLQGRRDTYPKRRGLTRVPELLGAGVEVAFGQDCVMDPWYGLGSADMLEVAHMGMHATQMTSHKAIEQCFEAVTTRAARVIGLPDHGLRPGCDANLVILQAHSVVDAIRLRATRLAVYRNGRCVSRTVPRQACLLWNDQPLTIDWLQ